MKSIIRLYQYVMQSWPIFSLGIFLGIIGMICGNLAPFFVEKITNLAQLNDYYQLFTVIAVFALVLIGDSLFTNLGALIQDKVVIKVQTTIAAKTLRQIHELDFSYHASKSSGKLISIMSRGDDAIFAYFEIINQELLRFAIGFGIMLAAFSGLNIKYTLAILITTAICSTIFVFIIKMNLSRRKVWLKSNDQVSSLRTDNLISFETVKYFAREEYEQDRFQVILQDWSSKLYSFYITFRYMDIFIGIAINLGIALVLFLAAGDLAAGTIQLGQFLLLITFALTFFPKILHLMYLIRNLTKTNIDLKRYFDLLDEIPEIKDLPSDQIKTLPAHVAGEINFDQVNFTYDNNLQPVLKNFNLKLKSGEVVALVGLSGAGKTTVVKLLMRMYDVSTGQITIDGIDIKDIAKSDLRSVIGIVPQDPALFNNTVNYNIAYARPEATAAEIDKAVDLAQAKEFIDALEKGDQTIVGERGIKLSGGQKQRLAIARVILKKAPIVIMDEATSALDSQSEKSVQTALWNLIRDPDQPRTTIIIAHRLSTIMQADRIIVLGDGEVKEIGTHQELLANPKSLYQKLWSLQQDGFIPEEDKN